MEIRIAAVEDIGDGGTLGTVVDLDDGPRRVILTRRGDQVSVFLNSCPHTGVRLDWKPGQFLDMDEVLLQCATPGALFALFALESGYCLAGPCAGQRLVRLVFDVRDGAIYIDTTTPVRHTARGHR